MNRTVASSSRWLPGRKSAPDRPRSCRPKASRCSAEFVTVVLGDHHSCNPALGPSARRGSSRVTPGLLGSVAATASSQSFSGRGPPTSMQRTNFRRHHARGRGDGGCRDPTVGDRREIDDGACKPLLPWMVTNWTLDAASLSRQRVRAPLVPRASCAMAAQATPAGRVGVRGPSRCAASWSTSATWRRSVIVRSPPFQAQDRSGSPSVVSTSSTAATP